MVNDRCPFCDAEDVDLREHLTDCPEKPAAPAPGEVPLR